MPRFKVSLQRRIVGPNERSRNPFLAQLPAEGVRVDMSVRTWELLRGTSNLEDFKMAFLQLPFAHSKQMPKP